MAALVQFAATANFAKTEKQLSELRHRVENLTELNEEIGAYLVSSTRNRIYSTKTAPDGERWAENSELTRALKSGSSILYHTGELASDIRVTDADRGGVTIVAQAPYAGFVQSGTKRMKGRYRSKSKAEPQIPARPFMGISDANKKRIAKMVRSHIASSMMDDDWGFGD